MRWLAAFLVVAAAGCGGAGSVPAERAAAGPKPSPLLAIVCADCGSEAILGRFDPLSLAPRGRSRSLEGFSSFPTLAPERHTLAVSDANGSELRFVDLRRMRFAGRVRLRGTLTALGWLKPHQLVAVAAEGRPGDLTISLIDPRTKAATRRAGIPGLIWVTQRVHTRRHLVVILGHPLTNALEPTELAVVDRMGRVRTVTLAEIRSGLLEQNPVETLAEPGFAVDPDGERAFVVAGDAPVAEIDLETMEVRYHPLHQTVSLLDRLHDWLEPAAQAKGPDRGSIRSTLWLGNRTLAVFGWDNDALVSASGRVTTHGTPAGLELIDTHAWTSQTVDKETTWAQLAGLAEISSPVPPAASTRCARRRPVRPSSAPAARSRASSTSAGGCSGRGLVSSVMRGHRGNRPTALRV